MTVHPIRFGAASVPGAPAEAEDLTRLLRTLEGLDRDYGTSGRLPVEGAEDVLAATLTTLARAGSLRRALDAGVRGYLLKDAPSAQLAQALRQVQAGGRAIDPQLAVAAWGEDDPLTERERQVLRLAGEGVKSAEIAERLHLSQGTVRNYLSEAIGKLGAANRIEAYRTARAKGWL